MRRVGFICKPCLSQARQRRFPILLSTHTSARASTTSASSHATRQADVSRQSPPSLGAEELEELEELKELIGEPSDEASTPRWRKIILQDDKDRRKVIRGPRPDDTSGLRRHHNSIAPKGIAYFERLAQLVEANPPQDRLPGLKFSKNEAKAYATEYGVREDGAEPEPPPFPLISRNPDPKEREDVRYDHKRATHLRRLIPPEQLEDELKMLKGWSIRHKIARDSLRKDPSRLNPPPAYMLEHHTSAPDRALTQLLEGKDVGEMRNIWQTINPHERAHPSHWTGIMSRALLLAPGRAHEVLEATFEESASRFYVASDCIAFFLDRIRMITPEEQKEYRVALYHLILYLLENTSPHYLWFSPNTTFHMAKLASSPEEVFKIYSLLKTYNPRSMNGYTKMHFARRIAADARYKKAAVEILRELVRDHKMDLDSPHAAALATSILSFSKQDARDPSFNSTRADVFEALLEIRVRPNLITFTAIIQSLCLSGDMGNAWQVFDTMCERGISPDAQLMAILLNGCKHAGDFKSMARIVQELSRQNLQHSVIFNDLINSIYHAYTKAASRSLRDGLGSRLHPVFPAMLQAYSKFYKIEPLQRLLPMHNLNELLQNARDPAAAAELPHSHWLTELLPLVHELDSITPPELLEPQTDTIVIMLMGYIKSLSNAYHAVAFYSNFRQLLIGGDRLLAEIVSHGTLIHDLIIGTLVEWPNMLRVALDIVRDMLQDAATANSSDASMAPEAGAQTALPRYPAPSVYTWSILLKGLSGDKQFHHAERILEIMREHGLEPCRVTWNTLTAGYARQQDVHGAVSALQRAERAGLQPDDFTMKAFSYLRDQAGALKLMEAMMERRKNLKITGIDVGEELRDMQERVKDISSGTEMPNLEDVMQSTGDPSSQPDPVAGSSRDEEVRHSNPIKDRR